MTSSEHTLTYSLSEILHSVREQNRTGLISILADLIPDTSLDTRYLWVQNGEVVAVANRLDGMGLLGEISRRKLLSPDRIREISTQLAKLSQPLGLHLKSLESIDAGHLKLLFNAQTFSLLKLRGIDNRLCNFEPDILPSNAEMTGISMQTQEIMQLLNLKISSASIDLTAQLAEDLSDITAKLPDRHLIIPQTSSTLPKAKVLSNSLLGSLIGFLKKKQ